VLGTDAVEFNFTMDNGSSWITGNEYSKITSTPMENINTDSELDINGGQMNINAGTDIRFATGGNTGTNTFNLNGGAVTFYSDNGTTVGGTGYITLGSGGDLGGYVYYLNGGTLTVPLMSGDEPARSPKPIGFRFALAVADISA